MISIGNKQVREVYLGDKPLKELYIGNQKVYSSAPSWVTVLDSSRPFVGSTNATTTLVTLPKTPQRVRITYETSTTSAPSGFSFRHYYYPNGAGTPTQTFDIPSGVIESPGTSDSFQAMVASFTSSQSGYTGYSDIWVFVKTDNTITVQTRFLKGSLPSSRFVYLNIDKIEVLY